MRSLGASRRANVALALLALSLPACTEPDSATLLGTVERTAIEIAAPVSEILIELPVQRGARVEAGQVVGQLDSTLPRAEREAAAAHLEGARAARQETAAELARVRGLNRAKVASPQDLDRARRAHDEAVARELESEARLTQAERRLSEHTLTAPVAGVVDQLPFDPGERVPPGGVVAVLYADGPPWVRLWCPARFVARLALGSEAKVLVHGLAEPFRGRVIDIAREPEFTPHFALTERESEYLVYQTRVEILNAPPGLRPGLPAAVSFQSVLSENAR